MCASYPRVRGLIVELTGYCKHTITDMEAGLEHLKRGTAKNVDMMIIVVEPYYRSLEAGMRTFKLAKELNINIFMLPQISSQMRLMRMLLKNFVKNIQCQL